MRTTALAFVPLLLTLGTACQGLRSDDAPPSGLEPSPDEEPCTLDGLELDAIVHDDAELAAALGKGQRIGLMPGTYGALELTRAAHDGVHLIGACREGVIFQADGDYTVTASGWPGHATFESMTFRDAASYNLYGVGFGFTVRDVDLLNAPDNIVAFESLVVVDIQDSRIAWPDTEPGNGVTVFDGPELTIHNLEVEAPKDMGLLAVDLDKLEVRGLKVTDRTSRGVYHGSCVGVVDTQDILLEDLQLLGCENGGLYVEDTTGVVRNAEVRGIHATATNVAAPGIVVTADSELLVQDSVLAEAEGPGALVFGKARFENTRFIDNHQGEWNTRSGVGIELRNNAEVELADCHLEANTEAAVLVRDDSTVVIEGGFIGGTQAGAESPLTAGVLVYDSGHATLSTVRVEEDGYGFLVGFGDTPRLEADDLSMTTGSPAVLLSEGEVSLSDVQVTGGSPVVLAAYGGQMEVAGLDVSGLSDVLNLDILEDPSATSTATPALMVTGDGQMTVTDAVIEDASGLGAATWNGGLLRLTDVTFTAIRSDSDGNTYGIIAQREGRLEATNLTLSETSGIGIAVNEDSSATLDGVLIDTLDGTRHLATAYGLVVQDSSTVTLTDLTVVNVDGPALSVVTGSIVDATRVDIDGSSFAGIVASGSHLTLTDSSIRNTRSDPDEGGGIGLYTSNRAYGDGTVVMKGVTVEGNDLAGVYAVGQDIELVECDVSGGAGLPLGNNLLHGEAVFASLGSEVTLKDTTLRDARTGLFLHAAAAHVEDIAWTDNAVDLHLQACDEAPESTGLLPEGEVCPTHDSLWLDLEFEAYIEEDDLDL